MKEITLPDGQKISLYKWVDDETNEYIHHTLEIGSGPEAGFFTDEVDVNYIDQLIQFLQHCREEVKRDQEEF